MYDFNALTLFLTVGITLVVTGVTVAGWKHKALIWGLIGIGLLIAISAVAWPILEKISPWLVQQLTAISDAPSSWFALFMFVMAVITFRGRGNISRQGQSLLINTDAPNASPDLRRAIKAVFEEAQLDEKLNSLRTELEAELSKPSLDEQKAALQELQGIVRRHHNDLLYLLDWSVSRAQISVLERLVAEAPKIEEMRPDPDPEKSASAFDDARAYIRKVTTETRNVIAGEELFGFLNQCEQRGDADLKTIVDRPAYLSPYDFRDYYLTAYKCNQLAAWLAYKAREDRENELVQLERLRERLVGQQKPQ